MKPLVRLWNRSKRWPWWGHALAVLVCLAALGGLLDALGGSGSHDSAPAPGDGDVTASAEVRTTLVATTTTVTTALIPTTPTPTEATSTTSAESGSPVPAATTTIPTPTTLSAVTPTSVASPPTTAVRRELDELVVATARDASTYRRAAFGPDWIDADHDCHNTRAEVLMEETLDRVTFNANGCTVATGRWVDPWSGFTSTSAGDFQIDHLVALADAWRSGASTWSDARRQAFAQNLDDPDALTALSASVNNAKGDRTPDQWKPPQRAAWCHYATAWVRIKHTWSLSITSTEKTALASMLATC